MGGSMIKEKIQLPALTSYYTFVFAIGNLDQPLSQNSIETDSRRHQLVRPFASRLAEEQWRWETTMTPAGNQAWRNRKLDARLALLDPALGRLQERKKRKSDQRKTEKSRTASRTEDDD
ncbi:hypothetical protein TWF696_009851 [Orbilia brochopaga]|uniref:Uncharacterized protein n=1 Tax=Orbilia brochopaga TaxID=3140254 RepID=A0AAV9UCH3_9PEZI